MKIKEIVGVVIASIVLRAFAEISLASAFQIDPYYLSQACQLFMYLLMGGAIFQMKLTGDPVAVFTGGGGRGKYIKMLVFWPVVLLMFSLGENAMEVLVIAQVNPSFAYELFHFHSAERVPYSFFSWRVLCFIASSVVVAAIVEEFVFRGVLLDKLISRLGVAAGIMVTSAAFTALHFSQHEYLSTFIFAVVLATVYVRHRSLLLAIFLHGSFNFLAFVHQYYFDTQWHRAFDQISKLKDWWPQLVMFLVSTPFVVLFLVGRQRGGSSSSITRSVGRSY